MSSSPSIWSTLMLKPSPTMPKSAIGARARRGRHSHAQRYGVARRPTLALVFSVYLMFQVFALSSPHQLATASSVPLPNNTATHHYCCIKLLSLSPAPPCPPPWKTTRKHPCQSSLIHAMSPPCIVCPVDPGFPFRLTPMSFALRVTNSP